MTATDRVTLVEVSPRDGLQNEPTPVAAADKIRLIDMLSACGFRRIEAASFVSPKWVPQMADAAEVMSGITRRNGVSFAALTPNLRGFDAAREARVDEVAIFGSASEGFSQKNINCSIAESLERFKPVSDAALASAIPVRGYLSCVIECPYDGVVAPAQVADIAVKLLELGCYEISLGDTIGAGSPETVASLLGAVLEVVPADKLAGHFHDTRGTALANIETCVRAGIRVFDSAAGGLGGCPYAPGAKGNVATESVLDRLACLGLKTGIDQALLAEAARFAKTLRKAV